MNTIPMIRLKRTAPKLGIMLGFLIALALSGCREKVVHKQTYRCPMHHSVVSEAPGACPVCGMDLVREPDPGESIAIAEDIRPLLQSPDASVVTNVGTIRGEFKSLNVSSTAKGLVTYDTRNVYTISARTTGRLEKVFIKYPFQRVERGQKVAEIYSPELMTAQRELLFLLAQDSQNHQLIEAAIQKLMLLGASSTQIEMIIHNKVALYSFPVFSQHSGYIITSNGQAPTLPAANTVMSVNQNAMASSVAATENTFGEMVRAGGFVSAGQALFKIIDPSTLRVELSLPFSSAGTISVHDKVDLLIGEQVIKQAEVELVQPFATGNDSFIKLRIPIERSQSAVIGQLVNATVTLKPVEGLWLPESAVMDLGVDHIVFIKDNGVFKPRKVTIGTIARDSVQVMKGLATTEEVAKEAHYLVDSESLVR